MNKNFIMTKAEGIFDKNCIFCNSTKNLKELKFYGGYNNNQNLQCFCICENCRKELVNVIKGE